MGLRFNTNATSLQIRRQLFDHEQTLSRSYRRLSSGLRIQNASDDPAGIGMASRLRVKASEYTVGLQNLDSFEGLVDLVAATNTSGLKQLERIKTLALAASDGTLTADQRSTIDGEYRAAINEIKRLADTKHNDITLGNGSQFSVSTRVGTGANDAFSVVLPNLTSSYFNTFEAFDLDSATTAQNLQGFIDSALSLAQTYEGLIGSGLNRISNARGSMQTQLAATQTAESRITGLDVAAETSALARAQILTESATALLAQANLQPRHALNLLQSTLAHL